MRFTILSFLLFISLSATGQNEGFFRPEYIGHPTDSTAWQKITWNPVLDKAVWDSGEGSSGNDSVFTLPPDTICVISMGDTVCVAQDSSLVSLDGDSLCVIFNGDTTCVALGEFTDTHLGNTNLTNNMARTFWLNDWYLRFIQANSLNGFQILPLSSQRMTAIQVNGNAANGNGVNQAALEITNSQVTGTERNAYIRYGNGTNIYSMGQDHSSPQGFTFSDSSNLKNPVWKYFSPGPSAGPDGDSLVISKLSKVRYSGVNSTSSLETSALSVFNVRTGTAAFNYGIQSTATGGSFNCGLLGTGSSLGVSGVGFTGVQGTTSSAVNTSSGVFGDAVAGRGVYGRVTTGTPFYGSMTAGSSGINSLLSLYKFQSGSASTGVGGSIDLFIETSNASADTCASLIARWTDKTFASRTSQFTIRGWGNAIGYDIFLVEGDRRIIFNGRAQYQQGADVASVAGAISLGYDGNVFEITGTNAITLISNVGWQNGSQVTFFFTSTASLTDGTANSGTDIGMELAGNVNFTGSADDSITLMLSEIGGTQRWREVSRSVN